MKKILLVEDDESLATLYTTEFELKGFKMLWEKEGEKGFKTAKKEIPDLIILDIMLPGASGLKILERLKKEPKTSKIPVVMLTNFGNEENVKRGLEGGAEDFILKYQIVPSEVVEKIKIVLGEGKKEKAIPITV